MDRSSDAKAKSLASGEMSRRESLQRIGGLLGGSALAYFGIGCAPDGSPVAPHLVRPTVARDVAALVGGTRFYLWEAFAAPVSPAVDAAWESSAGPFARRPMHPSPAVGDSLKTISGFNSKAGRDRCHRQFIGPPMAAGQVFDTSVTYKAYAQVLESSSNDELRSRIGIRIVSRDGSTVRHTVKAIADYSSGTEWSTSLRSTAFLDGDAGTGSYTTVAGDRLVVEFGHRDGSGATISGSSRWGSTATGGDVPENETTTSTTVRPWFECSLNVTFETAPQVTQVTRYVNTASTPGGDGTTNDTVGANRAFASLVTALTTLAATDWAGAKQQLRILCSGTTPDTGDAVVTTAWNGRLSPECYLEIIGDQPSALAISTSHYRCVDTEPAGFGVYGGGYVRLSRVAYQITVRPGTAGYSVVGILDYGGPMDVRLDSVRVDAVSIAPDRTSSCHGFWTDVNGPANKVTYTNCVVVGWTGTGAEHHGFTKSQGTTGSVRPLQLHGARVCGRLLGRLLGRIGHGCEELRGGQLRRRIQRDVRRRIDQQRQQPRRGRPRNECTEQRRARVRDRAERPASRAGRHGVDGSRRQSVGRPALRAVDGRRPCHAHWYVGHRCGREYDRAMIV